MHCAFKDAHLLSAYHHASPICKDVQVPVEPFNLNVTLLSVDICLRRRCSMFNRNSLVYLLTGVAPSDICSLCLIRFANLDGSIKIGFQLTWKSRNDTMTILALHNLRGNEIKALLRTTR